MKGGVVRVSPAGLIFWSFLFFMLPEREAAALLVPVAVHEAGHLLSIKLLGFKIHSINLELTGLKIEYSRNESTAEELAVAAAGPLAGIGLWLLCDFTGAELMAGVSLLLSIFNLLPIYPLDGGRICRLGLGAVLGCRKGKMIQQRTGDILCCVLVGIGFYLMLCGWGAGMFAAGAATLLLSLRED